MCGVAVQSKPCSRAGRAPPDARAAQRSASRSAARHGAPAATTLVAAPRARPASPHAACPAIANGTGCQSGDSSREGSSVRRRGPLPSAFMTQMSDEPPRSLVNAIFVPSGDQIGPSSCAGSAVRRRTSLPSASMT